MSVNSILEHTTGSKKERSMPAHSTGRKVGSNMRGNTAERKHTHNRIHMLRDSMSYSILHTLENKSNKGKMTHNHLNK